MVLSAAPRARTGAFQGHAPPACPVRPERPADGAPSRAACGPGRLLEAVQTVRQALDALEPAGRRAQRQIDQRGHQPPSAEYVQALTAWRRDRQRAEDAWTALHERLGECRSPAVPELSGWPTDLMQFADARRYLDSVGRAASSIARADTAITPKQ